MRKENVNDIPSDTLVPLFLAGVMFVFFLSMVLQWIWVALASLLVLSLLGCYWMWPRPREAKEIA